MEYKIISRNSDADLEKEVQRYLDRGYIPLGAPIVRGSTSWTLVQAMIWFANDAERDSFGGQ